MGLYERKCSYSDCAKCIRNYTCKITEECRNFYCETIYEPSCASESTSAVRSCLARRRERIRRRWATRENQKDRDFEANLHHHRPISNRGTTNFEEYMRLQEEKDEMFLADLETQKHETSFFSDLDSYLPNFDTEEVVVERGAPNEDDGAFNIQELVSLLPTTTFKKKVLLVLPLLRKNPF